MKLVAFTLAFLVLGVVFYSIKYKVVFNGFKIDTGLCGYTVAVVFTVCLQLLYLLTEPTQTTTWTTQTTLPFVVLGYILDLVILEHNELFGRGSVCVVAAQAIFSIRAQKTATAYNFGFTVAAWVLFGVDATLVGGLLGRNVWKWPETEAYERLSVKMSVEDETSALLPLGVFF